MYLFKDKVSN
jgi:aminopeptidase N